MKVLPNSDQISKLMQEMRALKQRSGMSVDDAPFPDSLEVVFRPNKTISEVEFDDVMMNALDKANEVMLESSALKKSHDLGDPGVDLTRTLIAARKAEVAFSATLQVRNKLVDAYKDIMNMQI